MVLFSNGLGGSPVGMLESANALRANGLRPLIGTHGAETVTLVVWPAQMLAAALALVAEFARQMSNGVANAKITAVVLAVLAAGIVVMTRETVQVRYGIADLAPRLVLGLVAANLSTPVCQGMINGANAVTQALTGDSISSSASC